jgi:hypothetical protein
MLAMFVRVLKSGQKVLKMTNFGVKMTNFGVFGGF